MCKNRIYYLRKKCSYTQEEVANAVHTTKQHISRLENNEQKGSVSLLIEIANFFNVTLDYLLEKETTKKPSANRLEKNTSK